MSRSAASASRAKRFYRMTGAKEWARQLSRALDFLGVVLWLVFIRRAVTAPSRYLLVELGPGPTRLARLKRVIFKDVLFIDANDYGVRDDGLKVADLERLADVDITKIVGKGAGEDVLVFADHCLEHLSEQAARRFFEQVATRPRWACCVRVPNVLSRSGRQNFESDETHKNQFGLEFRKILNARGIACTPWYRFYRLQPILDSLVRRSAMLASEEVVFTKAASAFPATREARG